MAREEGPINHHPSRYNSIGKISILAEITVTRMNCIGTSVWPVVQINKCLNVIIICAKRYELQIIKVIQSLIHLSFILHKLGLNMRLNC